MVNVPSPDKVHVTFAWIALKEITQRNKSIIFFIVRKDKKGRRLSDSLVLLLRLRPSNLIADKYAEKSMPYTDMELFTTCSRDMKIGRIQEGENKSK